MSGSVVRIRTHESLARIRFIYEHLDIFRWKRRTLARTPGNIIRHARAQNTAAYLIDLSVQRQPSEQAPHKHTFASLQQAVRRRRRSYVLILNVTLRCSSGSTTRRSGGGACTSWRWRHYWTESFKWSALTLETHTQQPQQ